jgi:hypothetical protein
VDTNQEDLPAEAPAQPERLTAAEIAAARPKLVIPPSKPIAALELPAGCTRWGTDLEKLQATEQKMLEASSPTPAVVKAALTPRQLKVGDRAFHVFTVQTYLNLENVAPSVLPGAPGSPGMKEVIRALWVMIEDDGVVEKAIYEGDDSVRLHVTTFAMAVPMCDLPALAEAIGTHIAGGFAPAAKMDPPQQEGGESPLDRASSATAPAGS